MADITLAEYTGFIYQEMIKAREMADAYSKSVAIRYEQDPVLKHFPTPRFKAPKINLTIPMLVTSARFSQVERFEMNLLEFESYLFSSLDNALQKIQEAPHPRFSSSRSKDAVASVRKSKRRPAADNTVFVVNSANLSRLIKNFHENILISGTTDSLIRKFWSIIFNDAVAENQLVDAYKIKYPAGELFDMTHAEISRSLKERSIIDNMKIQSLLINPETTIIKNGTNESSVFVLQAEMTEEGFFLRTIKDSDGGEERKIVEFE